MPQPAAPFFLLQPTAVPLAPVTMEAAWRVEGPRR
jgi:hypothetical protein